MRNYQVRFRGRGTGGPSWIAWPLPDSGARVSAAAIHPVSTARAAGLDEFRGPAPDHTDGLFRPMTSAGSADPGPTAHAILDSCPRSPWKLPGKGPARRLAAADDRPSRNRARPAHAAAR